MSDSQWLAVLGRFGLVQPSDIAPKNLRELRLVSRYRRKLTTMHSAQVNRLHKVLDDGSLKLGGVVSDINGVSASAMVQGLVEGRDIASLLDMAHGLLQTISGIDEIAAALILIEIGDDMTRFGCAQRLASWAALCPGNNESAGKREVGQDRPWQRRHPVYPV